MYGLLTGGLTIRLNTVDRQAECGGDGAVVRAEQAGKAVTFQSRAAVIALPLGVLRSGEVTFSPALPAEKAQRRVAQPRLIYAGYHFVLPWPLHPAVTIVNGWPRGGG